MPDQADPTGARPVLAYVVAVANGLPLAVAALFTGLFFHGNQCTNAVNVDTLDFKAFGIVLCVCYLINILAGLWFHRQIRVRSRSLSTVAQLWRLLKSWPGLAYAIVFVFEVLYAVSIVIVFPGDAFCALREPDLVKLGIALGYLLIVALIAFVLALVINVMFACGRPYDDDEVDAPPPRPKKAQSGAAAPPPATNPFADEPVASAPADDDGDDAPPPPVAKTKKKSPEELADEEWQAKVNAEKGI